MVQRRLTPHRPGSDDAGPSRAPGPDEPIPSVEIDGISITDLSSDASPVPTISVSGGRDAEMSESIGDRLRRSRLSNSTGASADLLGAQAGHPVSSASTEPRHRSMAPSLQSGAPPAGSPGARRRRSSPMAQTRYDVRDEAPPQDRFHEPAFQRALAEAQTLMTQLAGVLGSGTLHLEPDTAMKTLHENAEGLARFECPPTRTVGLVGDSGVGKSSLINSLLDFRDLARTSGGGKACTCVVTEYYYHDNAGFAVDVVFFSQEELKQQLSELVQAYRHNHFRSREGESDDEQRHWAKRAQLAENTFKAMFGNRFTTARLLSDNPERSIVDTYLGWARDWRATHGVSEHTDTNSLTECSDLLMRLTSNGGDAGRAMLWPYIKKISVFLNAHILSKGLVLVDLPGLRDLNSARQNITERYLRKCNEVFAVCPINRAASDESVQHVFELARQAEVSNVNIICTQSDLVQADESRRDWDDARAREVKKLSDAIAEAKQHLVDLQDSMAELGDPEDMTMEEQAEKARLHEQCDRMRDKIKTREFELKQYLITTRNRAVTDQLSVEYAGRIPGANLHVFCASNVLYRDKRDLRPSEVAARYLKLSGIPIIRKHCMGLVSESQLGLATKYLRDEIPSLLSQVDIWVQTGSGAADAERKRAVREALDRLEEQFRRRLLGAESPLNNLARELTDIFKEMVYRRRETRRWTEGAIHAGLVWSSWSPPTYAAFCRNYGTHSTKGAKGYHCWNEEAMKSMNDNLADPWRRFKAEAERRLDTDLVSISESMEGVVSHHLENNVVDVLPESIGPLRIALQSSNRIHVRAMEDLCAAFEANLSKLRTDALSGLRTSYFGQSMEPAYWNAILESGSGSWNRKKDHINTALAREALFTNLMRRLKGEFEDLAARFETGARAAVEQHLGVTKALLDMVRSENVALESERDLEFRARVEREVGRVKGEIERVTGLAGV